MIKAIYFIFFFMAKELKGKIIYKLDFRFKYLKKNLQ